MRILFLLIFFVKIFLIPVEVASHPLQGMDIPVQDITADISQQEVYIQNHTVVSDEFVQLYEIDEFRFGYIPSQSYFELDYFVPKNLTRISPHNSSQNFIPKTNNVSDPATLVLFGLGLVFLAKSGRRLKRPGTGVSK